MCIHAEEEEEEEEEDETREEMIFTARTEQHIKEKGKNEPDGQVA